MCRLETTDEQILSAKENIPNVQPIRRQSAVKLLKISEDPVRRKSMVKAQKVVRERSESRKKKAKK